MAKRTTRINETDQYDPFTSRGPSTTADVPTAAPLSNEDERAQFEERVFLEVLDTVRDGKSAIGEEMAEINEAYKRLKPVGFTKADVKWAFELEEKDYAQVIATMQRRIRIAKMLGHGLARQVEMFETDRAPIEERAYAEGLAAGKRRKPNINPYGADSKAGQEWQRGMNDGTAIANKDLADVLIKGPGSSDSDERETIEEAA